MNALLTESLKPLASYYGGAEIEEVAVNRPGEVWIKAAGTGWVARRDRRISETYVITLCHHLANAGGQVFHPRRLPLLYATLPEGHRFTALVGPNVGYELGDRAGIAVTIRVIDPNRRITLDRYGVGDGLSQRRGRYAAGVLEDLVAAVQNREAVLVSGATATGKTSFLNALVAYLPPDWRIVTVEDVRELLVPHANRLHLLASRTEAANRLEFRQIVDAVVRLTPDVILCGEIGIANAAGIFRLMTTGHTNFMATIHAHDPSGAVRAFYQNLAQAQPGIDARLALDIIRRGFGRIVQLDRAGGRRMVTAVALPES